MIYPYSINDHTRSGVVISSLFLFLMILLSLPLPAKSISSRPHDNIFSKQNPFPDKIFLNIDNGVITLIAKNSPLLPVIEEISRRSGVKIEISSHGLLSMRLTVSLKDVPFEDGIKKIADSSGLIFGRYEEGTIILSHSPVVQDAKENTLHAQDKDETSVISKNTAKVKHAGSVLSGSELSQNKILKNNIVLNEMVIRFKQDISEQDIKQLLSDSNIKVKRYIAALKYHIILLPDGMTCFDALVLLKNKKMLYQDEPEYLIQVK